MLARDAFLLALDPGRVLHAQGLTPDPWQQDLLFSTERQVLLNCSRQSGKSTVVAARWASVMTHSRVPSRSR